MQDAEQVHRVAGTITPPTRRRAAGRRAVPPGTVPPGTVPTGTVPTGTVPAGGPGGGPAAPAAPTPAGVTVGRVPRPAGRASRGRSPAPHGPDPRPPHGRHARPLPRPARRLQPWPRRAGSPQAAAGAAALGRHGNGSRRRSWRRRFALAAGVLVSAVVTAIAVVALSAWYHLDAMTAAVRGGDVGAARSHLAGLRADVRLIGWAMDAARPLAAAPGIGRPVRDLTHVSAAASAGVDAAATGLDLYAQVGHGQLVHDGGVDLGVLRQLPAGTEQLGAQLTRARSQLAQVRGGWAPGVSGLRDAGLRDADRAVADLAVVDETVSALPAALGAEAPRNYVVATLNSGELYPSGGALLAVALVRIDQGRIQIVSRAQVSEVSNLNQPVAWTPLPSDPWQRGFTEQRLAKAPLSPDFPTTGEEILRLYQAQFGTGATGVIALDGPAFSAVLALSGPVTVPGYGQLTSANVVRKTLVEAYSDYNGKVDQRHEANNLVIDAVFTALLRAKPSGAGVSAVLHSISAGHIQLYFRDPALQAVLERTGSSHALTPFGDDALGVYTMNTNASKVDVFQQRAITQDVQLDADGSARVTRTVVIRNAPQRTCPTGPTAPVSGYLSCVSHPSVLVALPARATDVSLSADGSAVAQPRRTEDKGRVYLQFDRTLEPGTGMTVQLTYRLPAPVGGGHAYTLSYDGQPTTITPTLTVRVRPGPGVRLSGRGWQRVGDTLTESVPLAGSGTLRVDAAAG